MLLIGNRKIDQSHAARVIFGFQKLLSKGTSQCIAQQRAVTDESENTYVTIPKAIEVRT